ncbi:unnamed protein product [Prorocentrum cordatum]|uniref:Uncharacterized protein n=1 Tax=Prorocentrum cordatum TaxID=2364126 RepID=A0ABN9QAD5_9DINO|nr:unnamed protein product [Polarella glacialis]
MLPFKGKQVLIKLICGGALPKELSENEFAKMLVRTARFLRWLAVGLCPEQFKLLESAQHKWLEASLASYMWQGVEDHCLEQWVDFVMEEKVSHVSLHFDGLRVDKGRALLSQAGGDAQATAVSDAEKVKSFCKKSEERILVSLPAMGIFAQMAALAGNWSDMSTKAAAAATPPSAAAASAASSPLFWAPPRRSYRTCARAANVKLLPVEVPQESCPGLFLVHCEPDVAPLCVGIDVKQRGPRKCYVGRERWSLPAGALDEAVLAALDRCMVVAFQMKPADRDDEDHRDSSLDGALDLFSGAGIEDNVAARGAAALRELGCSIRGIVPFDRRRLTWHGNCIPFGIAALAGDWDGVIAAATVDSGENAAAMASGLRRYSDCANPPLAWHSASADDCGGGHLADFLFTEKLQAENIAQLSKYSSTAAASYTQKGYLGTYLEAAFALGGGHSSTLGDDVAARDAMGMVAGAGVEEEGAVDVANAGDEHAEELDDDSCARVHANLLQLLRDEVTDFEMIVKSLSRTGATKDGNGSVARCLLCPFKEYSTSSVNVKRDLLAHIANHHGLHRKCENGRDRKMGSGRYVASDTKQWKVIQALFDDNMLSKHQPKNLLQRSADLMRRSVSPPLRCLGVDKQIRLLLDHDGPRFVNFEVLARDGALQARRVGNTYYTKEFAELVFRESILHEDPVHLAIVYNQAHWRKHSPGQAVLRIILNKFTKVSSDLNGAAWGAPYTGHQASSLSAAEGRAQSLIAGGGMQKRRAHKIIADLDANEPFVRKLEFIEALAALTSVYWEEVDRRTPAAPSKKLADVIANAAQHSRCEYLFNNLRMRHSLPARAPPLLGSGTSPNEALHSEINKWFKNQLELHAQTLELQLGVNVIGKQMMHNSAMYAPTLRQLSSQTVAASVVCSFAISAAEWANHCASQAQEQRAPRQAQLPLALQRKAAEPLANKWKVDHKRMVGARKPAGQQQFIRTLKRPGAAKQRKRTPFSLVRKRS